MAKIKFEEGSKNDLPIGSYEPCRLESVTFHEPDEEALRKWPDMGNSWCFRFVLHKPGDEFDGFSGVRFVNDSSSKLGNLYLFLCDLAGGRELEEADPEEYAGRWFRIRVRKRKQSEKLHVAGADPIDPPAYADEVQAATKSKSAAKGKSTSARKPKPAATTTDSPAGPPDDENPF